MKSTYTPFLTKELKLLMMDESAFKSANELLKKYQESYHSKIFEEICRQCEIFTPSIRDLPQYNELMTMIASEQQRQQMLIRKTIAEEHKYFETLFASVVASSLKSSINIDVAMEKLKSTISIEHITSIEKFQKMVIESRTIMPIVSAFSVPYSFNIADVIQEINSRYPILENEAISTTVRELDKISFQEILLVLENRANINFQGNVDNLENLNPEATPQLPTKVEKTWLYLRKMLYPVIQDNPMYTNSFLIAIIVEFVNQNNPLAMIYGFIAVVLWIIYQEGDPEDK